MNENYCCRNRNNTGVITTDSTNSNKGNNGSNQTLNSNTSETSTKGDKTKTEMIGTDGKKTTIKTKPGKVKVKED